MEDCTSLFSIFRQRQSCLAPSNCTSSSHLPTEKSSLIETVTGYVSILICLFIWCRFVKEVFADISCVVILAIVKDHLGICLFKESISCSTTERSGHLEPQLRLAIERRTRRREAEKERKRERERNESCSSHFIEIYNRTLFTIVFYYDTAFYDMKGRVAH
ncbi:hypothetical protein T02_897 [Trichinella nativa]|uniref:Uncharacterized protein n=1 Tax=Trichinella nativa TaxID=6335 RepID=A0A0V1KZW2_9BILA|nr:hypothetical protein T02_897 [Trichinella nativa]